MNDPAPRHPPVTVLPHVRPQHNLPVQRLPLVGRERELANAIALLRRPEVGLLTLTGPGGVGKTRLAFAVATELLDDYRDGAWFVSLAPLSDPDLVPATIAQVLGVRDAEGRSLQERLIEYMQERELLLLLDNCEHLPAAAPFVAALLAASPGLGVLVTSRAPLRLTGEHEYLVAPLALPPTGVTTPEEVARYSAVELFCQRVRAVRPDFTLTDANAADVATICRRLDGLPLALELAAARIKVFSPAALLARLSRRLELLANGSRDLPARQRTLRTTIGWSHDLLRPSEQLLLRQLAVFAGGCTLDAVNAVCEATEPKPWDLLDGMTTLVDMSLVQQQEQAKGESRFVMLETVREFALERLEAAGETTLLSQRHAQCYLTLAEEAQVHLRGSEPRQWLDQLDQEHDNLRAALAWSVARPDDAEMALRLVAALHHFWAARGYLGEARQWLAQALTRLGGSSAMRARALYDTGFFAQRQGDLVCARMCYDQALTLFCEVADARGIAAVHYAFGALALNQGEYKEARVWFEKSLAMRRRLGNPTDIAQSLKDLGEQAIVEGDHARANARLEESLTLFRQADDKTGAAYALNSLGALAGVQEDYARAEVLARESLMLHEAMGSKIGRVLALLTLARVEARQERLRGAAECFREALLLAGELGDLRSIMACLAGLAGVAEAADQAERSARLFGAAEALQTRIGSVLAPTGRIEYLHAATEARRQLGEMAFASLWSAGQAMSVEQAISEALTVTVGEMVPPEPLPPPTNQFTQREVEIVRLVAAGRSNREIAETLVLSVRTVERHVENVYAKLGVHGQAARAAVATYAARAGLLPEA